MTYKKLNTYTGWLVFLAATIVYFITIEDTVSLWDCGEYITAAYKLEVGHPPGAPFFMIVGRLFSFFADPENVAIWINRLSAISSSLTILFMFWSLTMLIKKMVLKRTSQFSQGDKIAIFGGAAIGSLAYTFSESFWFSAVEGEVYAMASLFTAVIFWAILKWDEEMMEIQYRQLKPAFSPDRWLLLIMFMLGLAIGVHLLGILVVPAIAFVIYFRYSKKPDFKGIVLVGIASIIILGFIQEGVIPGSISLASAFEVSFVNSLGLPFYTGSVFFFLLLIAALVFGMRWARKSGRRIVYSSLMGLVFLLIGYSSFAVIVIRSNANPPLDENDPENLVTLHSYLKREQYGSAPLLFGQYWNSEMDDRGKWGDNSPFYLRRHVVVKGDQDIKAYKDEARAKAYAKEVPGAEVVEKYYMSNESVREDAVPTYSQTTFFPRMYWNQEAHKVNKYKYWSGYDSSEDKGTEIGSDGQRLPTFNENMTYFWKYQINFMYWRYFLWNFAGRQNDIQGHGSAMRGNWKSGFNTIDEARLGNQEEAPYFTSENKSNNSFYFLPLIFGLIGMVFHFYRAPKDAFVVLLAFLFTGIAIVVYLNQKPYEPRERDYAYAGSFYFFAMWIGVGAYALYEAFRGFSRAVLVRMATLFGAGLAVFLISDAAAGDTSMIRTMIWLFVAGIALLIVGSMVGLGRVLKGEKQGSIVAILVSLAVPVIMGMQGWDDHDRSLKSSARDLAINYLNSCGKNGIIFTNGDNDTFPLWYMQEVEEKRTDVRVCNLSLMQTDWYTEQMKMKAYDSDPLPIKFTEEQILMYAGNTDQVMFMGILEMMQSGVSQKSIKQIIELRLKSDENKKRAMNALNVLSTKVTPILQSAKGTSAQMNGRLSQVRQLMADTQPNGDLAKFMYDRFNACLFVVKSAANKQVSLNSSVYEALLKALMDFEEAWNYTMLSDAMEYVRNDKNIILFQGQQEVRTFPSSGFIFPVNTENAVKSGIIETSQKDKCHKALTFKFDKRVITREQLMMLDIMANNDWSRGLYFSSPGGSDVAKALYRSGYVKQNGLAFELSPLNSPASLFNEDRMYKNLMEVYTYGPMDNPDVLTDYYTRRHTSQYRSNFLMLAEHYMRKAISGEEELERLKAFLERNPEGDYPDNLPTEKDIKEWRKRSLALIRKSLEVMPPETVIDHGEPQPNRGASNYKIEGREMQSFTDGTLHDYVGILYLGGDKTRAEKLGETVADQLESIIDYFAASGPAVLTSRDNTKDMYAALDAYFKLLMAAADEEAGNPNGQLAMRMKGKIDTYYKNTFPSMMDMLKDAANENGESTRRGSNTGPYARALFELQDYTQSIAISFGLVKPEPQQESQAEPQGSPPAQLNIPGVN